EDTNYRVSGSTNITSNFTSSDASDNSWKSTQVWIFDENNIETNGNYDYLSSEVDSPTTGIGDAYLIFNDVDASLFENY
ncbi:hypothetical protein, partial [Paraphotobacterium marinum]